MVPVCATACFESRNSNNLASRICRRSHHKPSPGLSASRLQHRTEDEVKRVPSKLRQRQWPQLIYKIQVFFWLLLEPMELTCNRMRSCVLYSCHQWPSWRHNPRNKGETSRQTGPKSTSSFWCFKATTSTEKILFLLENDLFLHCISVPVLLLLQRLWSVSS